MRALPVLLLAVATGSCGGEPQLAGTWSITCSPYNGGNADGTMTLEGPNEDLTGSIDASPCRVDDVSAQASNWDGAAGRLVGQVGGAFIVEGTYGAETLDFSICTTMERSSLQAVVRGHRTSP